MIIFGSFWTSVRNVHTYRYVCTVCIYIYSTYVAKMGRDSYA